MYAIVEIAGKQFTVQPDEKIYVPRLSKEAGSSLEFENVLLHFDGTARLGSPYIANAKVTATVLAHGKNDTVIVFKKKKRKGYRLKRGHRQQFTQIQIQNISL